ncbi:MAG: NAD(P)H-dependent oxidoreductase [Oscillospiraceae bacterium]|nr:NAD(P)H-dependent oxidoreductase [Oscillospiraceae bacterium]
MKRTLSIFLTLALMLTLAACGSTAGQGSAGSNPTPTPKESAPISAVPETTPTVQPEDSGKKILIAYFSATNNTENIANHLNEILDADLYEIVPETPYTSDDLNYNDSSSRSSVEMNDSSARPAISGGVDNMERYDVIFLGYPIWWGEAPRIISTFLESYNLSGKTIAPFCTSGSSPLGSSARNLQGLADSATWLEGRRFSGGASASDVQSWVDGLNLNG